MLASLRDRSNVSNAPALDEVPQHELPCTYLALVIVDETAEVKLSFWNGADGADIKTLLCGEGSSLKADLRVGVAELIAHQKATSVGSSIVLRDGGRTLRLSPLAGAEGSLSALVMEADRHDGTLTRAASRFNLTPRQTEVLALILEGASAHDIAHSLVISEYTAQGYVKSLLAKTDSRNRAAMVAKVLNWKRPRGLRLPQLGIGTK